MLIISKYAVEFSFEKGVNIYMVVATCDSCNMGTKNLLDMYTTQKHECTYMANHENTNNVRIYNVACIVSKLHSNSYT